VRLEPELQLVDALQWRGGQDATPCAPDRPKPTPAVGSPLVRQALLVCCAFEPHDDRSRRYPGDRHPRRPVLDDPRLESHEDGMTRSCEACDAPAHTRQTDDGREPGQAARPDQKVPPVRRPCSGEHRGRGSHENVLIATTHRDARLQGSAGRSARSPTLRLVLQRRIGRRRSASSSDIRRVYGPPPGATTTRVTPCASPPDAAGAVAWTP
jgi:hypothetical protein